MLHSKKVLTIICDFTRSKARGKLEKIKNKKLSYMHMISLFLHGFNISIDKLVKIELFSYILKLNAIIFQREII